jgi:hypothetical protein
MLNMQKLYCYVDETGQDTQGKIFIVSIVIVDEEREELLKLCEQLEILSGKRKDKWGAAKHERRMRYLRHILADDRFNGKLRYSLFRHTRDYDASTIEGIAKGVLWNRSAKNFTSLVYVDGLSKTKRRQYAVGLRRYGVPTRKVMGVAKDESNALTRLADSIAGFVGDALKGRFKEIKELYERAKREQILIEV